MGGAGLRHGVPLDLVRTVTAYWQNDELSQGDRQQRLAAADYFWAHDAVQEALAGEEDVPAALDALLMAPNADPCCVGAGPWEDLRWAAICPGR